MDNYKTVDGKNAVLVIDGQNISVVYKNAFGMIIEGHSRRVDFTYDDVADIEFKKPGISMNGFILFVLKNDEMHKIVLTKLDEYSFEITDEMVKDLEQKLEKNRPDPDVYLTPEYEPQVFYVPPKEEVVVKKDEKELDGIKKPNPTAPRVTKPNPTMAVPIMDTPFVRPQVTKPQITKQEPTVEIKPIEVAPRPKTKEEIEKEKIREELNKRIQENKEQKKKEEVKEIPIEPISDVKKVDSYVVVEKPKDKVYIEEAKPVAINPLKQTEIDMLEKSKHDIIIDELENKLQEIEQELLTLGYYHMILEQSIEKSTDKDEIKEIIRKIEELIKQLEAIKKEILNKMDGKEYVVNMALDVTGDGKVDVDDFKTIYVKTIDKITEFEKTLEDQKKKANDKAEEIGLTDEEYEKNAKKLEEQLKKTKEYDKIINRTREYVRRVAKEVGSTEEYTRYYTINIRQLREDTRLLLNLSAASMLIPGTGPARSALTVAAGVSAMRDMLIPARQELRQETYYEPIDYQNEIRRGIRDVNDAVRYIDDSRKSIADIKKEIDDKFRNYPEYYELKSEFEKIEVELDRQEKEIVYTQRLLRGEIAKNNSKVLTLEMDSTQH